MSRTEHLGLFQGFGIEVEFMIVDASTLAISPTADLALTRLAGGTLRNEVELGGEAWSNELVKHVIELKTNGAKADLPAVHRGFLSRVVELNAILAESGQALMPAAMHPTMDPAREMHLWPADEEGIYETYHRIFDCRGHGWANLQSIHVNFPFKDDGEFSRLHAAIRAVLPLVPALAAASPVVEGRRNGRENNRLDFYKRNQIRVPEVAGKVIPEAVSSQEEYLEKILKPMYQAIAPHDPGGILQEEWLNSRGAIARFDRHAIEIRLLDAQESVKADLAVAAAVISLVKAHVDGIYGARLSSLETDRLANVLDQVLEKGADHKIHDSSYLAMMGPRSDGTLHGFWTTTCRDLAARGYPVAGFVEEMEVYMEHGNLARRIMRALDGGKALDDVYRNLCRCLADDRWYVP